MKITAEFNSNEELANFISTFGAKTIVQNAEPRQCVQAIAKGITSTKTEEVVKKPVENKKEESIKEVPKEETPKEEVQQPKEELKEAAPKEEDTKVTKEMVRAVFSKIIKAGKQKEAKALTEKYGASKLPEVKEEDYAAIYKEAEGLI